MTSNELKQAQDRIGANGVRMAQWLGVTPLTYTRWRTSTVPVPGPVALAVKALASGWRP